ncbi:DUF1534 domain-containing protein [Pseudomonas syringae]|uniref:DUF1534 domain-containing protein n=1 Tax=Pseudomonas syringae TaxID=317 RepID=A0A9Q4FJB0_PSESX|nr:DUF1534 domain-containing protein [Pseudomonas syringae]
MVLRARQVSTRVAELSFPTLQHRNALGDAPPHNSASRRILKTGRRASGNACPRGARAR